jgi:hypothetical protein
MLPWPRIPVTEVAEPRGSVPGFPLVGITCPTYLQAPARRFDKSCFRPLRAAHQCSMTPDTRQPKWSGSCCRAVEASPRPRSECFEPSPRQASGQTSSWAPPQAPSTPSPSPPDRASPRSFGWKRCGGDFTAATLRRCRYARCWPLRRAAATGCSQTPDCAVSSRPSCRSMICPRRRFLCTSSPPISSPAAPSCSPPATQSPHYLPPRPFPGSIPPSVSVAATSSTVELPPMSPSCKPRPSGKRHLHPSGGSRRANPHIRQRAPSSRLQRTRADSRRDRPARYRRHKRSCLCPADDHQHSLQPRRLSRHGPADRRRV